MKSKFEKIITVLLYIIWILITGFFVYSIILACTNNSAQNEETNKALGLAILSIIILTYGLVCYGLLSISFAIMTIVHAIKYKAFSFLLCISFFVPIVTEGIFFALCKILPNYL